MPSKRPLFTPDHEMFRDSVRRFVETELKPHHAQWEEDGLVPREVWRKAGDAGLLCCNTAEKYGGTGSDFLYNCVVIEEMARAGVTGPGFNIHSDMVATYIERFGSEELKKKWLPGMVSGEVIGSLGITEPGAGSDVRGIRTSARREGDEYVINGQKTYISNGQTSDVVMLVTKSDPARPRDAISLFLVETNSPGFKRGRNLKKLGLHAQDTSELFFDDVRVPASNLIGEEHVGFKYLTANLAHERLVQAVRSCVVAEVTIEQTVEYTSTRKAFGQTIADFQNTQFKLAELHAATVVARAFVDRCIEQQLNNELDPVTAAIAKMQLSDLHCRVVDECLQLHGGWGYMWEFPVCRAYADARIVKIAGGAMEVMKQIISRDLFKRGK
ncbi:acyl-CoA dehydrogenase family protein [Ottowia thiooxydans]|uniref:acyl-CoA dehydrogenase family protein n=1 Tax=Ottowia thiooxydans TaxID=219182 RepID=UPI0003FB7273|nr:acyl-CoA dehydrogenase family protein [Ottowia thiooxydans]